jgi:magnesium transporter
MLTAHTCTADKGSVMADLSASRLPKDVVWIDLLSADPAEVAFVERATGLHVPTMVELSEIESSSRLRSLKDALYLSTPLVYRTDTGDPLTTSVGFILRSDLLITVRFDELKAFSTFAESAAKVGAVHHSSAGAFVGLVEAIIDRMADALESVGRDLDAVSKRIFRDNSFEPKKRRRPAREDADLRGVLRGVGRAGDLTSKIRDTLLGFGRIVPYVLTTATAWLPPEVKPRLETVRQDIISLSDYDAHLTNNVQLLLDATLGLINTEQNNIIKVLTIVSVVGVPPTLVASMYGMNFHDMPELAWSWGYPYGLALIALSAIAPLAWFKIRGWL